MHPDMHLLGKKVRDRINGVEGVVTSISFDVSGCVQGIVHPPGMDDKGELRKGFWADTKRLEVIDDTPAIPQPDFVSVPGCVDKPLK